MKIVDKFIIYDDVQFIKKGWIHRNRIIVNGDEHLFTLPIKDSSQNRLIADIYISETYSSENLRLIAKINCNQCF